jgi:hypothetical protein
MKATHQVGHSGFVRFRQQDLIRGKRSLGLALLAQLWMIYCIGGSAALAQSTYGTILGTISDQRGGVLAAAKVTLKDRGTATERTGTSNQSGDYSFSNVGPGSYDLAIELTGFQSAHIENFTLQASETKRVDASLTVGSETQSILVQATSGAVLNTDVSSIAQTKTSQELIDLPVAITSRAQGSTSPMSTLTTQPGVQTDSSGNISVMGSTPHMFEMTIDGISTMGGMVAGPITELFPSFNAIEEIRVNEVDAAAEYGGVANISTVSKSGTNTFHGGGFENWQNQSLNAQNPFSLTKAQLNLNDYGGYVGGPLTIPHLYSGHDRTFFFAAYEGLNLPKEETDVESMPTAAMRNGDLSAYLSSGPIYNPYTGAAYSNNVIPQSQITTLSAAVLNQLFPLPNTGGAGAIANNYAINFPTPISSQQGDLRLDQVITTRQTFFIRGNFKSRSVEEAPTNANGFNASPVVGPFSVPEEDYGATAAYNYIITPNLLNELRTGVTGNRLWTTFGVSAAEIASSLGLTGLSVPPGNAVPDFEISGFQGTGGQGSSSTETANRTIQVLDNVSWTKSNHTLKFGGDFRRMSGLFTNVYAGKRLGVYNFNGGVTGIPAGSGTNPYIGNVFASFLLGIPDSTFLSSVLQPNSEGYAQAYSVFAQDDWRVSQRLTINIGMRWEYRPMFQDHLLNSTQFLPNYTSIVNGVAVNGAAVIPNQKAFDILNPAFAASISPTPIITAAQAGIPQSLRFSVKTDFQPRIGAAWRPFGNNRTVIRGGFGRFIAAPLGELLGATYAIHSADQGEYFQTISNGQPSLVFPHPFPSNLAVPGSQYFQQASNVHFLDPSLYQWNLTFERDLGYNIALQLSYSGNHGANLSYQTNLDQLPKNTIGYASALQYAPYPLWAEVEYLNNGGTSNYNSFSVTAQKRLTHGLQFNSNYSFTRSLTDAQGGDPTEFSNVFNVFRTDPLNPNLDKGPVAFTRRHRFLTTALYDLPFGRNGMFLATSNGLVNGLVGGWEVSGVFLFQSGPFLTITVPGSDPSGTGFDNLNPVRPDRVPGVPLILPNKGLAQWINPAAFVQPPDNIGRFGNSSVGNVPGIGTETISLSLIKSVNIKEGIRAQGGIQAANLFNHTNYEQPNTTFNVGGFGQVYNVQGAEGAGPRAVQVTARVTF